MIMKRLLIFVFLWMFCANSSAQNQLWKRMQKKIENKIENKVESKMTQKADRSLDKVLDTPFNTTRQSSTKASSNDLPANYDFSWKYEVQIQTQNSKPMNMTYFLQPNAAYQGMVLGDIKSDMFMIMDFDRELMISLFDAGGSKMGQIMNIPKDDGESADGSLSDYEISTLPDQVIAGYKCKGMQLKNKEYLIKYYFTDDIPVTLNGMNRDKKDAKLAKVINGINSKDPGLMMKMDLTDLKNKKNNMVMECKSVTKSQKSISKNDYKFL